MCISKAALVMLLFAGLAQLRFRGTAATQEPALQHAGSATTDPCKNPDPKASKSDLMRLWLTITTKPLTPGDVKPEHWPALCPATVHSVASLTSSADTKKVVGHYAGWYAVVKKLAIVNGQYDADTANRIWILAVSRQDAFRPTGKGLKPDIEELFQHLSGSPPLPRNAALYIGRVNLYVSGNRIGVGQSLTQVRSSFVISAKQANVGWGGPGHPSGTEVATQFP
jgi:hypothetical protein